MKSAWILIFRSEFCFKSPSCKKACQSGMLQTVDKVVLRAQLSRPFFQIHTRKSKRCLHLHPRLAIHLCISESMVFLSCSKDSFYSFFSVRIQIFHAKCTSDILAYFHVFFPDMTGNYLHVILTMRTLLKEWTAFACCPTALVFPVSITISC